MGHSGSVVSADEKYKVAGLGLLRGNRGTDIAKALCAQPSHVPSAVIDYPAHKAAAIKAGAGRAAAPHIRIAYILFRLGHHCGKGGVLQSLRGNVVIGRLLDGGSVGIGAVWEQVRPVAQRVHIHRIQAHLFLAHDVNRQMGHIEVFQLHVADVIGVGN